MFSVSGDAFSDLAHRKSPFWAIVIIFVVVVIAVTPSHQDQLCSNMDGHIASTLTSMLVSVCFPNHTLDDISDSAHGPHAAPSLCFNLINHPSAHPSTLVQHQTFCWLTAWRDPLSLSIRRRLKAPFTQDAKADLHANLRANPLMLLATCVNTPIDHNGSKFACACCEVLCVLCEVDLSFARQTARLWALLSNKVGDGVSDAFSIALHCRFQ